MKYLLSTGETTTKIEYYILDLFKLNLQIYPSDIPGAPGIGFDFIFNDIKKDEVVGEVQSRLSALTSKIKNSVTTLTNKYEISIDSIEILDETRIRVTITVNEISDTITVEI